MSKLTLPHLEALREAMRNKNVDAVIIPGTDPHHSEYVSDHWKFRDWITGFTGSNGTAVVTADKAGLWTDSRYFLQAEQQLADSGFEMHKENTVGSATITEWLAENLDEDSILAIDGRLFSVMEANRLDNFCGENGYMFATNFYPADEIWPDRPSRPANEAYVHDESIAGETVDSKITRTLQAVEQAGANSILLTALDEIAWLFNLRGTDVAYTPVAISFAFLSEKERCIFIDDSKVTAEVRNHLKQYDVRIRDYDDVERFLEKRKESDVVFIDPNRVSDALAQCIMCGKVYGSSPVIALKAVKNEVQISGTRQAMLRDGAALVRMMKWLEDSLAAGQTVTELDVDQRLQDERGKSELYRGDSFAMIAGYKEHGAIVHYQASEESASTLKPEGLLLIDTGGQYLDGTTDITRTITLGTPTEQEKHDFTLVLKGHLALARAKFPVGTTGGQLDVLARMPLWQEGMTFGHGTGHGVGHFLGCHEGPQSIRTDSNPTALEPGMITSNEPGLYKTGQYGIRTECLMLTVEGEHTAEFGDFLEFETLTLFPYDVRVIDQTMLTAEEKAQINAYHKTVLQKLTPLLEADEQQWLAAKCTEI